MEKKKCIATCNKTENETRNRRKKFKVYCRLSDVKKVSLKVVIEKK